MVLMVFRMNIILRLRTPPEIDDKYMARAEQIKENAVKVLGVFESSPDYVYLLEKVNFLTPRQCSETYIVLVLNHVSRLKSAIDDNDLVCMRRYENADYWLKDFSECRNKVEKILSVEPEYPQGQLSLFDVFPSGLH